MKKQSIPLPKMAGNEGKNQGYTSKVLSEAKVERQLMWLIQVGLLRREVDGQGITDSFRLTPLGRQIVEEWEAQPKAKNISWIDRLLNTLTRWVNLSL